MRDEYRNQVRLLLQVLPGVAKQKVLALKGGTAINFFWRDFPRLSVDIDLTYLPVKKREESLMEISQSVQAIADDIRIRFPETVIVPLQSGGTLSKLMIRETNTQIKLEVNTILRGSIFGPTEKELNPSLQKEFELYVAVQTLSFEDLYAGKICAALDRQHPRDLFDVKLLLDNEGVTEDIRIAFIGYLISHSRPINEVLNPNMIDLENIFKNEFYGMTNEPIDLDELVKIQEKLPGLLLNHFTDKQKEFLITFKKGVPQWELISVPHLKDLPGVKWKLHNIAKMERQKHKEALNKLEEILSG